MTAPPVLASFARRIVRVSGLVGSIDCAEFCYYVSVEKDPMWCADCQQDVPAVAPSADGPLICPKCHEQIAPGEAQSPIDTGVNLETFRPPGSFDEAEPDFAFDPLAREEAHQQLRSIGRKLRSTYHSDHTSCSVWSSGPDWLPGEDALPVVRTRANSPGSSQQKASVFLSILLAGGVFALAAGIMLLVWSAAFQLPLVWQWGMTVTFAAEATLVVGLVWMAVRLWGNSRRMNRQLAGIDQQLNDMHHLTGSLIGSRLSASQHFYDHYNQEASPHLLVANLRGQMDQLSRRLAA